MKLTFTPRAMSALSLLCAGGLMISASAVNAQPRPKTMGASASPNKPNTQQRPAGRAGTTKDGATSDPKRPNVNRNRVGYILTTPRKVTFKLPTKSDRTAASTLRRNGRGNQVTRLGSSTLDKRSASKSQSLAAKQSQRGAPQISPTSTAALKEAARAGFPATTASRDTARLGAAPIGSGRITNPSARQWGDQVAATAQRKGQPAPKKGFFRRVYDYGSSLFQRNKP